MRHGFDDAMTFMNATVAFICFVFMFVFGLMGLKGWATKRCPSSAANATVNQGLTPAQSYAIAKSVP